LHNVNALPPETIQEAHLHDVPALANWTCGGLLVGVLQPAKHLPHTFVGDVPCSPGALERMIARRDHKRQATGPTAGSAMGAVACGARRRRACTAARATAGGVGGGIDRAKIEHAATPLPDNGLGSKSRVDLSEPRVSRMSGRAGIVNMLCL
jgi:hypothetical protein